MKKVLSYVNVVIAAVETFPGDSENIDYKPQPPATAAIPAEEPPPTSQSDDTPEPKRVNLAARPVAPPREGSKTLRGCGFESRKPDLPSLLTGSYRFVLL